MKTKSNATAPAAPVTSLLQTSCAVLEQRLGPIEERPLDTLRGYEGHARKHPEKQIVQLMASIGHFGTVKPMGHLETDLVSLARAANLAPACSSFKSSAFLPTEATAETLAASKCTNEQESG